jgi:tetratricopeptide (TPR) repeat protein
MPFGIKADPEGGQIDFDLVYEALIAPAVRDAGLEPLRADAEQRPGSIHADMFQELLLADVVVADLSIDNPNAFYELGVRHALRDNATVTIFSIRGYLPFDVVGERALPYGRIREPLDRERLDADRAKLTRIIVASRDAWRGRKTSPVYRMLPFLQEPEWRRLKVGAVNEYWEALQRWNARLNVARKKQRPGDILLLADETPTRLLEVEALASAAKSLLHLNRPKYALSVLDKACAIDADALWCRQQRGLALGRLGRHGEAETLLRGLADEHRDAETLGLLGRTCKDHWVRLWCREGSSNAECVEQARAEVWSLEDALKAYGAAFVANPAGFYPGVNALTLGHLWRHLTGEPPELDLDLMAQGVRWAAHCALVAARGGVHGGGGGGGGDSSGEDEYWALATMAEVRLVADGDPACRQDFERAAARARRDRNPFALDSTRQQLDLLRRLEFRPPLVEAALATVETALAKLREAAGRSRPEPHHVVLFSGHMIDDPERRGPGRELPARFPADKAEAALGAIEAALDEIGAGPGDLGLCGGACGGDLLFAHACLARGMYLEVRLARQEAPYVAESVTFADPDGRWYRMFREALRHERTAAFILPDELGAGPDGVSMHDRNNRWQLYSALSWDLDTVSILALWDGAAGDGPGGTEHMVEHVRGLTGRRPLVIDPAAF